jgi:hypothetical protein
MIRGVENNVQKTVIDLILYQLNSVYIFKPSLNTILILSFCLYLVCGLTLREEYRLRLSENKVLRRIFGPKKEEITRGWRKLHSEELHNMYAS